MANTLCITYRFIHPVPLFHGTVDMGRPEWPPSPMRAFQALVNAASNRRRGHSLEESVLAALGVIESIRPCIIAPPAQTATVGYRAYVPHNQADLVSAAWDRGNFDASIALHRIEKDHRPTRIEVTDDQLPAVHYIYTLDHSLEDCQQLLDAIRPSVRSISALGWGIDQVAADATLLAQNDLPAGERWNPSTYGGRRLRVPRKGTLDSLAVRHEKFLNRIVNGNFTPVPPISAIDIVAYRHDDEPAARPHIIFKLLDDSEDTYSHPHSKLICIAGMLRHLAIEAMKRNPPPSIQDPVAWVERYVAGHRNAAGHPHLQLSYIPLPSIGHHHTDPSIRRVMIVAPIGDDGILEHISQQLDGLFLKPEHECDLSRPVFLNRVHNDKVARYYTDPSNRWASVTPVILPGHDDHKPAKTRKLIEKALAQSGIEQPCTFEWSAYSHFPKSFSAHKYDKDKRKIGYIRPDHLKNQTAVHLTLTFTNGVEVPGPLTAGSGRHCGLGLLAAPLVKEATTAT